MTDVAIVGFGHVGKGMQTIFPDARIVDPDRGFPASESRYSLAIVCVPTPQKPDGSCDVSVVRQVIRETEAKLFMIKSTVEPGTTDALWRMTGKRIVFSPEYMGESRYWTPAQFPQPRDPVSHGFCILGGDDQDCSAVADILLPRLGPATRFRFMRAIEAELVKYFENAFFAMKVTFANEVRRICTASGVNYHVVREGWIDDPRVGPMHTAAFADRPGFDGKCLPKDLAALASYCRNMGFKSALLEDIISANMRNHGEAK